MLQLELDLELTVRGPFLSKSAAVGGYGVDAVALRTPDGRPVLPGSQVRGRVREALLDFEQADSGAVTLDDLGDWLGPTAAIDDDETDHGPRPEAVFFSDFTGSSPVRQQSDRTLTRIQIDRSSGSVVEGAMLAIDPAADVEQELALLGTVELWASSTERLLRALNAVYRALCWAPAYGSFRTVGFGRLVNVRAVGGRICAWQGSAQKAHQAVRQKLEELVGRDGRDVLEPPRTVRPSSPERTAASEPCVRFDLTVQLLEPFCTGERRTSRNVLVSTKYLSGAVLKGAVAGLLRRIHNLKHDADLREVASGPWKDLANVLSDVRFCAAFPVRSSGPENRPVWQPQSFVKDPAGRVYDVALCLGPFVFRMGRECHAPAFAIDWKNCDTPGWKSGWREPDTELRLHTAIDDEWRRAKYEYLFGQELVRPEGVVWRGAGDLSRLDEAVRPVVPRLLHELLRQATIRIGKTKARARVDVQVRSVLSPALAPCRDPVQPAEDTARLWVITLQSPALLLNPRDGGISGDSEWLRQLYDAVWKTPEFSDGTLELVRCFTRQSLHGGFLADRATGRRGHVYYPFLLTDAGSVFVLRAPGDVATAQAKIATWYERGLPLPEWARERYGEDYRTNPFLPQDGFGEIAVNLPCHLDLMPTEIETCEC
jgi:hypothetical protein